MNNKKKVEDLEREKNNSLKLLEDQSKFCLINKNKRKYFRKPTFYMTKEESLSQLLSSKFIKR